jgi:hypothetical protein
MIFLTGKVVVDDGGATVIVDIQTVCKGRSHSRTDSHGGLAFSLAVFRPLQVGWISK